MSRTDVSSERVVIAVDPHKASCTAAAVNASLQPVATLQAGQPGGLPAAAVIRWPLAAGQLGDQSDSH